MTIRFTNPSIRFAIMLLQLTCFSSRMVNLFLNADKWLTDNKSILCLCSVLNEDDTHTQYLLSEALTTTRQCISKRLHALEIFKSKRKGVAWIYRKKNGKPKVTCKILFVIVNKTQDINEWFSNIPVLSVIAVPSSRTPPKCWNGIFSRNNRIRQTWLLLIRYYLICSMRHGLAR